MSEVSCNLYHITLNTHEIALYSAQDMAHSKKEYEIKTVRKSQRPLAKFEMVSTSPQNARKCTLPDISPQSTDHSQPRRQDTQYVEGSKERGCCI